MAASFQVSSDRFGKLRLVRSRPWKCLAPGPIRAYEPRAFPQANTAPTLSETTLDEVFEQYAFTFCQGGFREAGMTFEQLLQPFSLGIIKQPISSFRRR